MLRRSCGSTEVLETGERFDDDFSLLVLPDADSTARFDSVLFSEFFGNRRLAFLTQVNDSALGGCTHYSITIQCITLNLFPVARGSV